MTDSICAHLRATNAVRRAEKRECAECVKTGSSFIDDGFTDY